MNTLPKLHIMICCNWRRRYLSGLAVRTEEIDGPEDVAVKCENTGLCNRRRVLTSNIFHEAYSRRNTK